MKNFIIYFTLLIILLNCKNKNGVNIESNKKVIINKDLSVKNDITTQQADIYIGKKFYEGDELANYDYFKGGFLSKDSLLTYSIYENEYVYVYSIENQISYEDVREYIIIDTLKIEKQIINDLKTFSYPLSKTHTIISFLVNKRKKNIDLNLTSKRIIKDTL